MTQDILQHIAKILSVFFVEKDEDSVITPEIDNLQNVKSAHRDWMLAQKQFEWVTDPDLIDQAIYAEVAARKRYTYLLKKAKETHVDFSGQS